MDKIKAYIERGREIEAKATPGPWHQFEHEWVVGPIPSDPGTNEGVAYTVGDNDERDAAFIAHARNHHARLLDALEEAVNIVERLSGFIHDDRCSGGHTASDCFKEDAAPIAAILEGEK